MEVAFPYDVDKMEVAKMKNTLGLEQVLLNTKVGPSLGHGARKGEENQFLESMKTSLEYCQALGVKRLHIMAGYRQEGVEKQEATKIFEDNLRLDRNTTPIHTPTKNFITKNEKFKKRYFISNIKYEQPNKTYIERELIVYLFSSTLRWSYWREWLCFSRCLIKFLLSLNEAEQKSQVCILNSPVWR